MNKPVTRTNNYAASLAAAVGDLFTQVETQPTNAMLLFAVENSGKGDQNVPWHTMLANMPAAQLEPLMQALYEHIV